MYFCNVIVNFQDLFWMINGGACTPPFILKKKVLIKRYTKFPKVKNNSYGNLANQPESLFKTFSPQTTQVKNLCRFCLFSIFAVKKQ